MVCHFQMFSNCKLKIRIMIRWLVSEICNLTLQFGKKFLNRFSFMAKMELYEPSLRKENTLICPCNPRPLILTSQI